MEDDETSILAPRTLKSYKPTLAQRKKSAASSIVFSQRKTTQSNNRCHPCLLAKVSEAIMFLMCTVPFDCTRFGLERWLLSSAADLWEGLSHENPHLAPSNPTVRGNRVKMYNHFSSVKVATIQTIIHPKLAMNLPYCCLEEINNQYPIITNE